MMRKKPMLAYPVNKKPIDYSKPTFIQPKLDGVRCVIQSEDVEYHESNTGRLIKGQAIKAYSRTGKEWKNINHILEQLKPFFAKYPNVILDGELYNHDFKDNFEQIISMVRKTKPTDEARAESAENVQFHCYDIIDEKLSFRARIKFVNESLMLIGDSIHTVDTDWVDSEIETKVRHQTNLNYGFEGSIVRTNEVYQCKRSHSLRKIKDFHDAEATITGWVEGKGKRIGTIGKFLAVDSEGNEFGMPVMDKFKYLQDNFVAMQGFVGQEATFTYFERTKANSYRHPLFKCVRNYE
jgi:DNA ligase-1